MEARTRQDLTTAAASAVDGRFLICRSGSRTIAIPLADVRETMRPLEVQPLAETPSFVLGLSLIRGQATPVVDADRLLGADESAVGPSETARRFVTIRVGECTAALSVDEVSGVRRLPVTAGPMPPLMKLAAARTLLELGELDGRLLYVLNGARLVPSEAWDAIVAETE